MGSLSLYGAMGAALKTSANVKIESDGLAEIGKQLAQARRGFKLEVADVAADLMIAKHHIAALEQGDWQTLPAGVYARGYLRKYANYLRLDSAKMLEKMQLAPVHLELVQTPIISKSQANAELKILLSLLALVLVALSIALFYKQPATPAPQNLVRPISASLLNYMQGHDMNAVRTIPPCLRERSAGGRLWECYLPLRLHDVEQLYDLTQTLHIAS